MSHAMNQLEQQAGICRECAIVRGYRPVVDYVKLCARHAAMKDWQPIETVPKDGSTHFVYCEDGQIYKVFKYDGEDERYRISSSGGRVLYEKATHWMPLPDPPKVEP